MKRLSDLLEHCNFSQIHGNTDTEITGITYDSRRCRKGCAFFAFDGIHTDGSKFIGSAVANGASAVFVSKMPAEFIDGITYIQVDNIRKVMSALSSALYDDPSSRLKVIGVTGTDGKSSSVFFLYQMLNMLGEKTGFLSTVEYSDGNTIQKNPYRQSTPESSEIMMILDEMARSGCRYAALESTSHGLSERTMRLADVKYQAGILTNITHEHLEFHGTLEKYADDKANLFRKSSQFNVVNCSDRFAPHFMEASKVPVYGYALYGDRGELPGGKPVLYADNIAADNSGTAFDAVYNGKNYKCRINIPGLFNVENFLGVALALIKITGFPPERIFSLSNELKAVKGRMEVVDMGQDFHLIVDYAHTPGAFQKLFPMMKSQTGNRLIAVFGSAGEKDTEKRAIQGDLASRYSDILILTDEDPRGEDSMRIIDDIASGICADFDRNNLYRIPDRTEAIQKAIELAEPGDTVLLLGKGHESTIIYSQGNIVWNERETAEKALKARLSSGQRK
ncbi:MAG: UDP-N-acetylmuramoyl-L-alanyl-D-glutamate--2,6-diaminopimelate ligase [Spirochaetia bacterium]|nr:UDP-N-acetylmuramoyl-L-alanyl-D-glutamate--2,6-diaminopimelate ligase [Spirochaetia bacterium]